MVQVDDAAVVSTFLRILAVELSHRFLQLFQKGSRNILGNEKVARRFGSRPEKLVAGGSLGHYGDLVADRAIWLSAAVRTLTAAPTSESIPCRFAIQLGLL